MAKLSIIGKVTLSSVILYAIVLTALEILVVIFHHNFVDQFELSRRGQGISEADLIYHALFILSLAFQVLICVDALWRKNSIQLIALAIFNVLSLAYAAVQLYQHMILEDEGTSDSPFTPDESNISRSRDDVQNEFIKKIRPLEYTIIGIVASFSVYLGALSYKLMKEFGWDMYKTYSADLEIRDGVQSLSILQTLIKLDIFFIGSYAIQLIPSQNIGYSQNIAETVLIFMVGTVMLLMAWYSIMKENKYLLLCVVNLLMLSLAYMIYRLVTINIIPKNGSYDPYEFTRRLLSFFLATTFCMVLGTIFYAIKCFRNMMRGVYIYSVYGLPGQEQQQQDVPEIQQNYQNRFNSEYLGYDGYNASNVLDESKRRSKRASKIAEVQNARLSRRVSID